MAHGGGLSPRVRGKLFITGGDVMEKGSIPACAGETKKHIVLSTSGAVYPRVCGGNGWLTARRGWSTGLSPRVRGKRGERGNPGRLAGSIPACAGETR